MTERNKRVFISDIHMGDENSLKPAGNIYPYGWLHEDRCFMLASFLADQSTRADLKQVVILGDLFDEWICPTSLSPTPEDKSKYANQFEKIAAAPQNIKIIENLRNIAESDIELVYVPGNHDMLMTEYVMKSIIPNITWKGTSSGLGYYEEDGIGAEHGHKYCLFCAPDDYDNPPHYLPLGHFISRVVTEKGARSGKSINSIEVLAETIAKLVGHEELATAIFSSIVDSCGLNSKSEIIMNGLNGYMKSLHVGRPEEWFSDLYEMWETKRPGNVSKEIAVLNETGNLHPAAVSQYFEKKGKPGIVIFGHTHNWALDGWFSVEESYTLDPLMDQSLIPYKHVYANSGTWINNKKQCTYIETEKDEAQGKHYVRAFEYKPDKTKHKLGERFKIL